MGIYVSNKGNIILEELVTSIFEAFLNEMDKGFFKENFEKFGSIENIELKGNKSKFKENNPDSKNLVNIFHYKLNKI